jgi:hypothetical protein
MSVQLILYPQSLLHNQQFIVDGINFTNIAAAYSTSSATPAQDVITNNPPSIVNTWYSYYTVAGGGWGAVAQPSVTTGTLWLFFNGATTGRTGVYQKLSGLTVGQSYEVVVNTTAVAGGTVRIKTYTGAILQTTSFPISTATTTQITTTFIANSANDIVLIEYEGTTGLLYIEDISIKESGVLPIQTYEGQVILDLYEEEDIPVTFSVDEFKNVAEKVQSYSKAFNLPATKRNNQIFSNLFEVTMVQDVFSFNPYIKTPCMLKENGFILFDGFLRLIDIQDKEAEISYNVNLYSEAIALADVLQNKTLQDIDLSELDHTYDKTNIKKSWYEPDVSGLPLLNPLSTASYAYNALLGVNETNVLKYPFVDWTGNVLISINPNPTGPTLDFPQLSSLEQAFRPFINVKYLINRIFADTDFTWTSTLFDTTDFGRLFMDFNWGGDGIPTARNTYNGKWEKVGTLSSNVGTGSYKEVRLVPTSVEPLLTDSTVPPTYQGNPALANPYIITAVEDNEIYNISYNFKFKNSGVAQSLDFRWLHTTAAGVNTSINVNNGTILGSFGQRVGSFAIALNTGDTLKAQFSASPSIEQHQVVPSQAQIIKSSSTMTSAGLLTLRGELNQWDFLKGIMTMFNIVSLPDEVNPSNINFETYTDVFIKNPNSTQLDWTEKIDVSEMKLTPLGDLNKKTIFKFVEDDDDYTFNVYKNAVGGHLYGSKVYDASGLNLLQGEEEIVAEPFAATVPKPLFSQFPDFVTPAIFSANEDATEFEGFDNAPRIMYNNGRKDTGVTYYIPPANLLSSENQSHFLQFTHLTDIATISGTRDFHFGECQLINPIGASVPDNLFNLYWLPYYNELYNPNTRIMTLKVNLTPSDINTFKFYDTVFIKNRLFRVNKIDYKPNDLAKVEFILIADLGSSPSYAPLS